MFDIIIGIIIGAAFSPLWVKIGSYLWSLFAKKNPAVAAEVAVAGKVASDLAAPVVAAAESKIPPTK